MGKIKNDFQIWLGNNHRNLIRGGTRITISTRELATIVEEYIVATASRLKEMEMQRNQEERMTEETEEAMRREFIEQFGNTPSPDGGTYDPLDEIKDKSPLDISEEEFEQIKRMLGIE